MITELPDAATDDRCAQSPDDIGGTWYVAQVLSRHEKRVARSMTMRGVANYLPVYESRRGDVLPLFNGYLFVSCADGTNPVELYEVRRHDSVYGIIVVNNQKRIARELSDLGRALAVGDVRPYTFPVVGQRCRIISGPMRGTIGTVIVADERRSFVLGVASLGAAEIKVDPDQLEIMD